MEGGIDLDALLLEHLRQRAPQLSEEVLRAALATPSPTAERVQTGLERMRACRRLSPAACARRTPRAACVVRSRGESASTLTPRTLVHLFARFAPRPACSPSARHCAGLLSGAKNSNPPSPVSPPPTWVNSERIKKGPRAEPVKLPPATDTAVLTAGCAAAAGGGGSAHTAGALPGLSVPDPAQKSGGALGLSPRGPAPRFYNPAFDARVPEEWDDDDDLGYVRVSADDRAGLLRARMHIRVASQHRRGLLPFNESAMMPVLPAMPSSQNLDRIRLLARLNLKRDEMGPCTNHPSRESAMNDNACSFSLAVLILALPSACPVLYRGAAGYPGDDMQRREAEMEAQLSPFFAEKDSRETTLFRTGLDAPEISTASVITDSAYSTNYEKKSSDDEFKILDEKLTIGGDATRPSAGGECDTGLSDDSPGLSAEEAMIAQLASMGVDEYLPDQESGESPARAAAVSASVNAQMLSVEEAQVRRSSAVGPSDVASWLLAGLGTLPGLGLPLAFGGSAVAPAASDVRPTAQAVGESGGVARESGSQQDSGGESGANETHGAWPVCLLPFSIRRESERVGHHNGFESLSPNAAGRGNEGKGGYSYYEQDYHQPRLYTSRGGGGLAAIRRRFLTLTSRSPPQFTSHEEEGDGRRYGDGSRRRANANAHTQPYGRRYGQLYSGDFAHTQPYGRRDARDKEDDDDATEDEGEGEDEIYKELHLQHE
ncbi:hypothetical protein T492DRAFT_1123648 [Pavlovales sp. CCMP2436]|nr:hypothetical protein T492DRAFT_1123648 [Pavlovales sp. CCMP2436]